MTTFIPLVREADDASPQAPEATGIPVAPAHASVQGLGIADVSLDPLGFWGIRQTVNRDETLAHCQEWMERLGWLANFDRVARGETIEERSGWQFSDSEVYKLLEAMAWELGRRDDPELKQSYEALVRRVAAAQDDDGYLGTAFGHPGLPPRYSDLAMGHELYNIGHLLQAATARLRTFGADPLVEVARRAADHVCATFGVDGTPGICGHPEIEVALVEFGRALREPRYIDQARLFVTRRGHGSLPLLPLLSAEYFQDDVPVREATVMRGHAVRALYLSAGAVDVATDTQDEELFEAVRRQWLRTVERRTYLTGGMGSRHQDEGFGEDWELPADRAYCETCAGVASVMLAWRLYLATGEACFPDLIERTLFNIIATSPRSDGRAFFYANPLHQREAGGEAHDGVNHRAEGGVRAPWFDVSCCPTNVARTLASFGAYVAARQEDTLILLQYASGQVRAGELEARVDTRYPDDGVIRVHILAAPAREAAVRLRVPGWADGATLTAPDGRSQRVDSGFAEIRRQFSPGDVLELSLPVSARLTWPDHRIDALRGTVAVERGPLVLCAESTDLPEGISLRDIRLDDAQPIVTDGGEVRARAIVVHSPNESVAAPPFGAPRLPEVRQTLDLPLNPYHQWAERGPAEMRVFLPTAGG